MATPPCPQCRKPLERTAFDVGYGIAVESWHCRRCGHNLTKPEDLKQAVEALRRELAKRVKIVRIGAGLGVRIPNGLVDAYDLKAGQGILLRPQSEGIWLVREPRQVYGRRPKA